MALAVSSLLNMLIPEMAKMHPACMMLVRILQGLVEVSESLESVIF